MERKIIDFRMRPATLPYKTYFPEVVTKAVNHLCRVETPQSYLKSCEGDPGSHDEEALELLYGEMKQAGIQVGVMNGRHSRVQGGWACDVEDDYLAELSKKSNGRLVSFAGVRGELPVAESVARIEMAVKELGLKGVCVEPGLFPTPMYPDDKSLFPIYQKCADLGVPLLFLSGPFSGPDLTYTDPVRFQHVAEAFPTVPIVLGHGAYPFVTEALSICYRHSAMAAIGMAGIYLSPDVFAFFPGGEPYIKAIEWLPDRFLFGSAYPFGNLETHVKRTLGFDVSEKAMSMYLYENAARLLKL